MRRKELGLHHRIVRGVPRLERDGDEQQGDGRKRGRHAFQRGIDRNSHKKHTPRRDQQHRLTPEPVRRQASDGLHDEGPDQNCRQDQGGGLLFKANRVDQIFLHIGRKGIRRQPAPGREHRDENEFAPVIGPKRARARWRTVRRHIFKTCRFGQLAAQDIDAQRQQRPDQERDAPAPGAELRFAQLPLQQDRDGNRGQLPARERRILEA